MNNCDSLRRYTVVGMGPGRGVLPGLDRGASEDLSLQALKSDAVLWKTKGTGRGTNMVLCRPGGRCFYFSLTFFFLLLFVVLSSFFGFSSYALQVCGQPFVRMLGRLEKRRLRIWLFSSSVNRFCVSLDSHFSTSGFCTALVTRWILCSSDLSLLELI